MAELAAHNNDLKEGEEYRIGKLLKREVGLDKIE